jgi:hypothetical protein
MFKRGVSGHVFLGSSFADVPLGWSFGKARKIGWSLPVLAEQAERDY